MPPPLVLLLPRSARYRKSGIGIETRYRKSGIGIETRDRKIRSVSNIGNRKYGIGIEHWYRKNLIAIENIGLVWNIGIEKSDWYRASVLTPTL